LKIFQEISWKKETEKMTEYLRYSDWKIEGILFFQNHSKSLSYFMICFLMQDKITNIIISGAGKE